MRSPLRSLERPITPPPLSRSRSGNVPPREDSSQIDTKSVTLAQVEEGKATIKNHLDFFSAKLQKPRRIANGRSVPLLLSIPDFRTLYLRNEHAHGHHFVIHQHNHPIAGVHYDLRLQFSETSCISFAIPYGLPGNPNSRKPRRLAVETRVHTLWNNLVETASRATGSMLIWDIGEYEVLSASVRPDGDTTDDDNDGGDSHGCARHDGDSGVSGLEENTKLIQGFQSRRIRLRLHGHRLPKGYTVKLSLPSTNDHGKRRQPQAKRRRLTVKKKTTQQRINTDSEDESNELIDEETKDIDMTSDQEHTGSRQHIEVTNAYPGATNDIGSVHQRIWFVTLDHAGSGFVKVNQARPGQRWTRRGTDTDDSPDANGFEPFYVMGADVERSVVTGRTSDEILRDEEVEGFIARKMWLPITV